MSWWRKLLAFVGNTEAPEPRPACAHHCWHMYDLGAYRCCECGKDREWGIPQGHGPYATKELEP